MWVTAVPRELLRLLVRQSVRARWEGESQREGGTDGGIVKRGEKKKVKHERKKEKGCLRQRVGKGGNVRPPCLDKAPPGVAWRNLASVQACLLKQLYPVLEHVACDATER